MRLLWKKLNFHLQVDIDCSLLLGEGWVYIHLSFLLSANTCVDFVHVDSAFGSSYVFLLCWYRWPCLLWVLHPLRLLGFFHLCFYREAWGEEFNGDFFFYWIWGSEVSHSMHVCLWVSVLKSWSKVFLLMVKQDSDMSVLECYIANFNLSFICLE